MTVAVENFEVNPELNTSLLANAFKKSSRLQIPDFLSQSAAKSILECLKTLDWRLVLNENGKHFDIHPAQIDALGPTKTSLIINAAKQRRHSQFQYLYKNYPIADMVSSGNLSEDVLIRLYETFNSEAVLRFLNQVTCADAEFCDMQATNFQAGHFLNHHDDGVIGKNRKFAYVYSLTPEWTAELGGQLEFFDSNRKMTDAFVPAFNTLSIFSVPVMHQVSPVIEDTQKERISITGWFRTHNSLS